MWARIPRNPETGEPRSRHSVANFSQGVSTDLGIGRKLRIWALPIKSATADVKKTTAKNLVVLQDLRIEFETFPTSDRKIIS